ncbi:MAG TPA: glycosyltransferase [Methanospirillum sp.]|nr:glycosyltransferase [Methanospirillum sp.]
MKQVKYQDIGWQPRVVVVGPSHRFLSGISYYTLRLANALSGEGDVVALLFRHMLPRRLFPGWRRVGDDSLTSLKYTPNVRVRELLDWYNPVTWFRGAREFSSADAIILEWWTSSVAHMYLALLVLNHSCKPVLIEFHEVVDPFEHAVGPIRLYARTTGRMIRSMADRYVVHSEHDRCLIAEQYHIPEADIAVIPHGLYDHYPVLDKRSAHESLGLERCFTFLFFGLIRPYKGVINLIHAFEMLPEEIRQNSQLLIVGEAWEDHESVLAIETSPVADRIRLENRYVSDDEVPQFFSAADALVLPYTRASQSGVAHIGVSYGLPIIASKVGGLAESLGGYEGTSFVSASNEVELCAAMNEVFLSGLTRYPVPEYLRWDTVARTYQKEIVSMIEETR